jgi:hypothetical protein
MSWSLKKWFSHSAPRRRPAPSRKLSLEQLEGRMLLSANLSFGQLLIQVPANQSGERVTLDRNTSNQYVVTEQSLAGGIPTVSMFDSQLVSSIKITTLSGGNVISVDNLELPVASVEIDACGSSDYITLSPTSQQLANVLLHDFHVNGNGNTTLVLNDQHGFRSGRYDISAGEVDPTNSPPIQFSNLYDLKVNTGNFMFGPVTINVRGTANQTHIITGTTGTIINVGSTANSLDSLAPGQGLFLTAHGLNNTLNLNDQGASAGRTYDLQAGPNFDQLILGTGPFIDYSGCQTVALNGTNYGNSFQFQDASLLNAPITVNGGAGWNTLLGPIEPFTTWNITGRDTGTVAGGTSPNTMVTLISFNHVQNLVGSGGKDTFILTSTGRLSGYIDGGGGTNTLQYSGWTTPTYVDLGYGTATGVGTGLGTNYFVTGWGAIRNIQNFVGVTSVRIVPPLSLVSLAQPLL